MMIVDFFGALHNQAFLPFSMANFYYSIRMMLHVYNLKMEINGNIV